jgi:hypothetical protein
LVPWVDCYVDLTDPAAGRSIRTIGFITDPLALLLPTLAAWLLGSRIWRLIPHPGAPSRAPGDQVATRD